VVLDSLGLPADRVGEQAKIIVQAFRDHLEVSASRLGMLFDFKP
jgi:hypothetical protein